MRNRKRLYSGIGLLLLVCMMLSPIAHAAEAVREKVNDVMYAEGLPIVDPGTFSFTLFVDDSQEDDDYVMFPILEEQTGIHVELKKYPYAVAEEQIKLQLSTGDYADCIGGWTLNQNAILTLGVLEGVYIPLEDYFEQYAPNIMKILELEGVQETMTAPDGHIYSIPYVLDAPKVPYMPFINTQWLENLGLEMPTTTEEFREVLRAFKAEDANGNGDPNDEIPFSADPDNKNLSLLAGWFGLSVHDVTGFTMEGDQLVFGANRDEYKEGMKFLAELYAEGLIDPELFTHDKAQWKAKGAQDIYGVSMMYHSQDLFPLDPGQVPNWEAVPVLSSPGVDNPIYLQNTYGNTVLKNQVVITDNAEHPEVIVRWWDNFLAHDTEALVFDNVAQSQKGPLGVTLFPVEGRGYRVIDVSTLTAEDQTLYDWGNLFPQSLPKFKPLGYKYVEDVPMYDEKIPADALYEPYLTEKIIAPYWITAEDADQMADISTAIQEYLKQKRAEWISGQADIEAEWEGYKEQLNKLGLETLIELRLKALE